MAEAGSGLVTILFTDLVGSTELLGRAGDEKAQRIFRAHHHLLNEVVSARGGHEVKWLGDGLMVAFPSAAEAVGCAVDMQQASREPVEGEQLAIRVGLNVGEALKEIDDYFGMPVVIARRLCDRAGSGQILCTDLVAGFLAGRAGFTFTQLGLLELKGVAEPVAASEVGWDPTSALAPPARARMVGRDSEFGRLVERFAEAVAGHGLVGTVTGEPGIGKTRMLEELSDHARQQGALVLSGRCFESDWAPPFGPFAEALTGHVANANPAELRADLGVGAPPVAQLVPKVRDVLPDVPDPIPVQPDEERFRIIDGVVQFLVARSLRAPVLVCLDDLQWSDKASAAMLRQLARFAPTHRILVVGAWRDVDVDKSHPLTDVLQAMARETDIERVKLEPLDTAGVQALLENMAGHDVPPKVATAWAKEVGGNPFFLEEMVRHLQETGDLYLDETDRWVMTRPIRELSLPDGVHDVVARRLSHLSETANKLLGFASPFEGPFRFDVVVGVAGVNELDGLDALDEALDAKVVKATGPDIYAFANTLIRHSLYSELSPSRQMRLHRSAAQALEEVAGDHPSPDQAAEIASQYHRSAGLSGAEGGVPHALEAARHAEASGAHEEAVVFLRMALQMLPVGDERRGRLLGRLGMALAWSLDFEEAVRIAVEAGAAIGDSEGKRAAAKFFSDAAYVCAMAGGIVPSWKVAGRGLVYADERDEAWARLLSFDHERRAAEDPDHPGIPVDDAERWEASRILRAAALDPLGPAPIEAVVASREEATESSNLIVLLNWAGEYARCLPAFEAEALEAESLGRVARAARAWSGVALCHAAVGDLSDAENALGRARRHAARLGGPLPFALYTQNALALFRDEGWAEFAAAVEPLATLNIPALAWAKGYSCGAAGLAAAYEGQAEEAIGFLDRTIPWLQRAPAWTTTLPLMASHAVEILWTLERLDHGEVIERALREKVIGPGFRHPMADGRLALARLRALQGDHDEAAAWFAKARAELDEQGVRPLRAFCDYDEALMYVRRGSPGDADGARPLLTAALSQFQAVGMGGWIRRAQELMS